MKILLHKLLLLGGAWALTLPAMAEIYVGGSVGETDYQEGEEPASFEVFAGYNLNEFLGVELFYLDLGQNEIIDPYDFIPIQYDFTGWGAALRASLPLAETVRLYGRLGLYDWESEVSIMEESGRIRGLVDKEDLRYGFGIAWDVAKNIKMNLGYDIIDVNIDESAEGNDNIDNVNLGLSFTF